MSYGAQAVIEKDTTWMLVQVLVDLSDTQISLATGRYIYCC